MSFNARIEQRTCDDLILLCLEQHELLGMLPSSFLAFRIIVSKVAQLIRLTSLTATAKATIPPV
jgi:hypothetical protein